MINCIPSGRYKYKAWPKITFKADIGRISHFKLSHEGTLHKCASLHMLASSRVGFVTHDRSVSTTRFRVLDRRSHNGFARLRTDRSPSGYS